MLHQRAGSRCVFEVHGHLRRATCLSCGQAVDGRPLLTTFALAGEVSRCARCNDVLKPDVTLFGEALPEETLRAAENAVADCDLMLVAGSSLEVIPVAELPYEAVRQGARLIIVNLTETGLDRMADTVIHDDVASMLPLLAAPFVPNPSRVLGGGMAVVPRTVLPTCD